MLRTFAILGLVSLFLFSAFTPPSSAFSAEIIPLPVKMLAAFFEAGSERIPSQKTKPFYRHSDPSLNDSLDAVAWALKRKDLRACSDLPEHPSKTDVLTLCIGAVQNDDSRCDRIDDPMLQKLCHEVVAV